MATSNPNAKISNAKVGFAPKVGRAQPRSEVAAGPKMLNVMCICVLGGALSSAF